MTPEESARFYGPAIEAPPSRLWMQRVAGVDVTCALVAESMQARAAAALVAGASPEAAGYVENESAGMLLPKLAALVDSMRACGFQGPPIEAAINARGQIVVVDGVHRTSVALALGLPALPVQIRYRAEEWQGLKWQLHALNGGVRLYQPVPHPDLAWPSWRVDTGARAEIIAGAVRGAMRGVELACHTGGVSFGLARRGIGMAGFDVDPAAIRIANFLRGVPDVGSPFATFAVSQSCPTLPPADFVACLSLLNHHQEDPSRWEEGFAIFRECVRVAPVVVLDAPAPGDPVGGQTEFTGADAVFRWCACSRAPGYGEVLARRGDRGLQRDLLLWRRDPPAPV